MIILLPIIIFFAFQLAFMSHVNSFTFGKTSNIFLCIVFTILSFLFIVLLFYDTERRDKIFNFNRKLN